MEYKVPVIERLKRENGKILIFTHENPDADGIGSMLGLYHFLKKKNKNVICGMKDDVPYICNFLPGVENIKKLPISEEFDLGIIVDAAGAFRAGIDIQAKEILRIDHHVGGKYESIDDYVNPYSPSTTCLIAEILKLWDEKEIDKDIATCLYTGLLTDTGSFRYNNVTENTFEIARFLVSKGADPFYIAKMTYERNKPNVLQLLQKTLSTLKLFEDGKIAGLTVRRKFLEETNTQEEDTEGFVNYARSIDGTEVGFIMIQKEDLITWRISLRGKGNVDVQKIAKAFGGGGHKDAAGCRIVGKEEEVREKLVKEIKKALEESLVKT